MKNLGIFRSGELKMPKCPNCGTRIGFRASFFCEDYIRMVAQSVGFVLSRAEYEVLLLAESVEERVRIYSGKCLKNHILLSL